MKKLKQENGMSAKLALCIVVQEIGGPIDPGFGQGIGGIGGIGGPHPGQGLPGGGHISGQPIPGGGQIPSHPIYHPDKPTPPGQPTPGAGLWVVAYIPGKGLQWVSITPGVPEKPQPPGQPNVPTIPVDPDLPNQGLPPGQQPPTAGQPLPETPQPKQ